MPNIQIESPTRDTLTAELIASVNSIARGLDRRGNAFPPVRRDTPLFDGGVLDSLSILHLMAAVERLTGREIPDHMVVMKHFRSIDAIVAAFGEETGETRR